MKVLWKCSAVHVGFAFLAMGGWTLWVNVPHGLAAAWPPALVQGTISGTITLLLKRALEAMVARLRAPAVYVVPPSVSAVVILAVLTGVHRLIGTPEITRTIAMPWLVSTLYAIVYASNLARSRTGAAGS